MTRPLFLFGTLRDEALLRIVAGRDLPTRPARLPGHRVVHVAGHDFPILVPGDGMADGLLVDPEGGTWTRLDFYELGFGYTLEDIVVETPEGPVSARVYAPEPDRWTPGDAWSLLDWQRDHAALARDAAEEYMRLIGILSPEAAARAFPQVRMRAASRLRAHASPTPQAFRPEMTSHALDLRETRQPYTAYFAVREDDLTFPTFDGGTSAPITRASFMGGDAVTVLPYDPRLDAVLVIRQFRHGAFTRGDANPWTLEPAAGRIDPGETPDQTALRELAEETGVTADSLHHVADYYPSPGAYSEYLYGYVATADLSDHDGRMAGLDGEDEDIMSHVIAFDDLMRLIATGAANSGPLVLTAFWLAGARDRLRAAD